MISPVYVYFCSQCTTVIPNEEEITDELEVKCNNCGETVTVLVGKFDKNDAEEFWKAYNANPDI